MTNEPIEQPDDNARVSRLSSPPESVSAEDTVREYEARYSRERESAFNFDDVPPRSTPDMRKEKPDFARAYRPRSYSTLRVSEDERLWASVAHISAWITFLGGIFTVGTIVPVSIFIPLVIYFLFRRKSDYVAFHALQAFVVQLLGTVGAFVLLFAGGVVWGVGMIIALLSMAVIVGFVLVPVWVLIGVALLMIVLLLPLAMVLFGTIAAVATYNGGDYQYPFIARWVDRQLAGGFLNAA